MKVIVERTNKRQLKICPQQDGSVRVVAYRFLRKQKIQSYIAENLHWVEERISKLQSQTANVSDDSVLSNEGDCRLENLRDYFAFRSVLICGTNYKVIPTATSQTRVEQDSLLVCQKYFADRLLRAKTIKQFLKKLANNYLPQEVSRFGSKISICPQKIEFKDLKNSWCSCQHADVQHLLLDYRLVQVPVDLQRYVIAHAFCHFFCHEHNNAFWEFLSSYVPNWKQCKKHLQDFQFLFDL